MERFAARQIVIAAVVVGTVVTALVVAGMWTNGGDESDVVTARAGRDARQARDSISSAAPEPPEVNLSRRLHAHIDSLVSAGGHGSRVVFTEGNRWSVEYVLRQMRRDSRQVSADTFYVRRRSTRADFPLVNAVAIVPGASDSILVLSAHIDASASRDAGWNRNWRTMRAPGADDNATGIAAMLEVLTLVTHASAKPRYTLMFVAFNAEERNPDYAALAHRDGHHLGSRHLAMKLKGMGKPIKGVIAMDMVGWNSREQFIYLFASSRGQGLARELVAQRDWLRLPLGLPSRFSPCANSDNESFDRLGIPAILFMESCTPWRSDPHHPRNPAYHSSRDLPDRITYPILEQVARLVYSYALSGKSGMNN